MDNHATLVAAERRYAQLLWQYERAEHAVEVLVGVKAVMAADARIQVKKTTLKADMARIARTIKALCDPEWTPGHIAPLGPKKRSAAQGVVSKHAYRIMRQQQRPMGARELAKMIAPMIGLDAPDHRQLLKIDVAVRGAFERRTRAGQLIEHPTKPKTWSIRPLASRASAASTPSTSETET